LIALIANARRSAAPQKTISRFSLKTPPIRLGSLRTLPLCKVRDGVGLLKTSFASNASGSSSGQAKPTTEMLSGSRRKEPARPRGRTHPSPRSFDRMRFLFTMS
jgi:hypothetical protein